MRNLPIQLTITISLTHRGPMRLPLALLTARHRPAGNSLHESPTQRFRLAQRDECPFELTCHVSAKQSLLIFREEGAICLVSGLTSSPTAKRGPEDHNICQLPEFVSQAVAQQVGTQ